MVYYAANKFSFFFSSSYISLPSSVVVVFSFPFFFFFSPSPT